AGGGVGSDGRGGGEVVVDGIADQGVREAIAPGGAPDAGDERVLQGRREAIERLLDAEVAECCEKGQVELPAEYRGGGQETVRIRVERRQALPHRAPDASGERQPRRRRAPPPPVRR